MGDVVHLRVEPRVPRLIDASDVRRYRPDPRELAGVVDLTEALKRRRRAEQRQQRHPSRLAFLRLAEEWRAWQAAVLEPVQRQMDRAVADLLAAPAEPPAWTIAADRKVRERIRAALAERASGGA